LDFSRKARLGMARHGVARPGAARRGPQFQSALLHQAYCIRSSHRKMTRPRTLAILTK
jgi:hypothetical protein